MRLPNASIVMIVPATLLPLTTGSSSQPGIQSDTGLPTAVRDSRPAANSAATGAKIGLPEIELGVVPAWGGPQRLTRTVGRAHALEIMLLGTKLSAEEAYRVGLVTELCAPDELEPRASSLAATLATKAPIAVAGILEAVVRGGEESLDEGLAREYAALERVAASKDLQEGVLAFFQKRTPEFKGE